LQIFEAGDTMPFMTIKIIKEKMSQGELRLLAKEFYEDMVKGVVDVERKVIALGGELHADAETILLDHGSRQEHLWGFNIFLNASKEERIIELCTFNGSR
jgi:hypothetical protein